MKRLLREGGFAILAWLVPFVVAVCIFRIKQSYPPLFESLMAIVLATSTVLLGCLYLGRVSERFVAHGARIGVIWMVANWLLDWPMFSAGPMQMTLADYAMDIGVAYLMIPAITIGLGIAAANARKAPADA